MNNNNFDIAKMISLLSKMDPEKLKQGMAKANQILQTKNKNKILNELNRNNNSQDKKNEF